MRTREDVRTILPESLVLYALLEEETRRRTCEKLGITAERIVRELAMIAFADVSDSINPSDRIEAFKLVKMALNNERHFVAFRQRP